MSGDPKQLMKEAEDALAGGWFSSADHLAAASLFERAGKLYVLKNKDGVAAMGAYLKAAKSHLSKGGRGYEAAAVAYEEAGRANPAMSAQLFKSAIELLNANGDVDRAIEVCARCADHLDSSNPEAALELSAQVGELCARSSTVNTRMIDAGLSAFKRLVKHRKIPEALSVGNHLLAFYKALNLEVACKKMYVSLMVLEIVRGDLVKAKLILHDALEKDSGFARSTDADAAQDFMQAYEQMNAELVKKLVGKPPFTSLEYAVAMLAQELNPGERVKKPEPVASVAPATVPLVAVAPPPPAPQVKAVEEEDAFPDLS